MVTCKCPYPCNSDNCQTCYYDNNTYVTNSSSTYEDNRKLSKGRKNGQ